MGNLPLANYGEYVDVGEGPPSETIRNVERTGTRVSLRDIQQAPEYAELIDECLDEVQELVAERQGGMTAAGGIPVHLLPRPRPRRCTSIASTASSSR